ncbi:hypothetical protein BpHYR1_005378 [Brachionus plicatilis]|uniref:Uncharacterized protein n=1 Tax=Brachionus plicatilis TaxID=10195 RepID=A0A3M7RH06_BRAPC|nr:hypothetical protein BpHYR1_005378 [Brachionus plicatilis]
MILNLKFKGKSRENSNISMHSITDLTSGFLKSTCQIGTRLGNICGEDDQLDSVTSVSDRRLCSKMIYYPLGCLSKFLQKIN